MQAWTKKQDPVSFVGKRVRAVRVIAQPPRSKDPDVPRGAIGLIEDYLGPEDSFMVDFEKPYGVIECYWDEITLTGPAKNPGPSFDEAMKALPACVAGGLDQPKTVSDLVYQALHELDMFEEGQDGAITARQAAAVRKFVQKFRTTEMR